MYMTCDTGLEKLVAKNWMPAAPEILKAGTSRRSFLGDRRNNVARQFVLTCGEPSTDYGR